MASSIGDLLTTSLDQYFAFGRRSILHLSDALQKAQQQLGEGENRTPLGEIVAIWIDAVETAVGFLQGGGGAGLPVASFDPGYGDEDAPDVVLTVDYGAGEPAATPLFAGSPENEPFPNSNVVLTRDGTRLKINLKKLRDAAPGRYLGWVTSDEQVIAIITLHVLSGDG